MHDETLEDTLACPSTLDRERLHEAVTAMYALLARRPEANGFHFHVGVAHAVERLGYDANQLARLPRLCTDRFAGVGRPMAAATPLPGAVVLDHACGAGTDLLLAALAVGERGHAIGVDLTPAMRETARQAARQAGLQRRVDVVAGDFEHLPVTDASVDMVLSNGVLNLAPDKRAVLSEAWRVLRPGGLLCLADVVLSRPLSPLARGHTALWAACVGGALTEAQLLQALEAAGFEPAQIAARHEPFAGTALPLKFGADLHIGSVSLCARKPG